MAKQAHTVIAEHFGMDSADVHEGRYHYGRTSTPVYVIGDNYYACSRSKPKHETIEAWNVIGELIDGRKIWEA